MADILTEIKAKLPKEAEVSNINFEAANIILYTKSKDFFFNNKGVIKELVNEFKKRVELRPDPSICMDLEKAKKEIKTIMGKEAEIDQIIFDPQRSSVIIEAKNPGAAIGQAGENLKQIRENTINKWDELGFYVTARYSDMNQLIGEMGTLIKFKTNPKTRNNPINTNT